MINGKRAVVRTYWSPEYQVYQLKLNGLSAVEYETDCLQDAQGTANHIAHGDSNVKG